MYRPFLDTVILYNNYCQLAAGHNLLTFLLSYLLMTVNLSDYQTILVFSERNLYALILATHVIRPFKRTKFIIFSDSNSNLEAINK